MDWGFIGHSWNYKPPPLAGAGALGFLIPPSIAMIVFGVLAEVSIGRLFLAGILPGLMIAGMYSCYIAARGLLDPSITGSETTKYTWTDRFASIPKLLPIISLIIAVLGSILIGWATPTEAAAIGVAGAFLLSAIFKTLTWQVFTQSLMGATRTSCMVLFLVIAASYLAVVAGFLGIPRELGIVIADWGLSPYMLLFVLVIFYIILGCLFDAFSLIIVTLPIVLPIVTGMGFDPVWFGIYLMLMVLIAQITPPIGFNLFVIQGLTGHDIGYIAKAALPFFVILLLATFIITVFPQIALWLPNMIIGR